MEFSGMSYITAARNTKDYCFHVIKLYIVCLQTNSILIGKNNFSYMLQADNKINTDAKLRLLL